MFRCAHVLQACICLGGTNETLNTPSKCASECVIHYVSDLCRRLCTHTCACISYSRCVCQSVCVAGAREPALCVQSMTLWHRGLFHVPRTRRGSEWSGGLEPGLAHCCPLSRAPGSQSTPGRPGPSAPALGICFRAWGWQLEVAAQRELGPVPTAMPRLQGGSLAL